MKVYFRTNLDQYSRHIFPKNLTQVPRVGDHVSVIASHINSYIMQKLPTRLDVVSVTWYEEHVDCELWYNSNDLAIAQANGAKCFG